MIRDIKDSPKSIKTKLSLILATFEWEGKRKKEERIANEKWEKEREMQRRIEEEIRQQREKESDKFKKAFFSGNSLHQANIRDYIQQSNG